MDPVFTLQWPDFVVAHRLQQHLPKKLGYSVLIPLSRQEKGIDLAILRKGQGKHRTVTIQIKASRTYWRPLPKRPTTKGFRYYTWFRQFVVPPDADFVLLLGMYAPDQGRTKTVSAKWYGDCSLLFTRKEMTKFLKSCRTVGGKPDMMFGFGFDDPSKVFLTRGDPKRSLLDFSSHVLGKRIGLIKRALA
jgi:hypothetical protein